MAKKPSNTGTPRSGPIKPSKGKPPARPAKGKPGRINPANSFPIDPFHWKR